jgi:cysteine desulfurase
MNSEWDRLAALKKYLKDEIIKLFPHVIFNGNPEKSLTNLLSVSFDNSKVKIDGEALILGLDLEGVAVSSGSACTSGSVKPSHVLLAMGMDIETAKATVRFSLGRSTTITDLDYVLKALTKVVKRVSQ